MRRPAAPGVEAPRNSVDPYIPGNRPAIGDLMTLFQF